MTSLRRRAILGGSVWALVSVVVGGLALLTIFNSIADRRFNELLTERHVQLTVALANSEFDPSGLERILTDPAYARPYSGRYWQVVGPDGAVIASRSLFDAQIGPAGAAPDEARLWQGEGPGGPVRGVWQQITMEDGSLWTVAVAETLAALNAERREMTKSIVVALSFVGVLGIAGAALLTTAVVRPLSKLREDVAHRWDAGRALDPEEYPEEVAPLVGDINTLLDRNREVLDRARRQAADLAHALKTPSAALRNELEALVAKRPEAAAALDALDRIDAQLGRSLARMRASQSASAIRLKTDLGQSVSRLARLFRSMNTSSGKTLLTDLDDRLGVAMDAQDVEELLGNLLENAFKWCRATVRITAGADGSVVRITVADDGPGIPEDSRRAALVAGGRLDVAVPGTGLGLAIATDLAEAYGGTLALETSEDLGGLAVCLALPAAALDEPTSRSERPLALAS